MIFKGICTAIVTPLTDDGRHINFEEFKKLIDCQIEKNVAALVFIGTTGEPTTLTNEEKAGVVKFAVDYVDGRVPVIAGAGSNSTKEAVEKSRLYASLGVDALLQVTPYYNKCTQKGLIEHFTKIADNVKVPVILYNVPSRTGINMLPATVAALSKHKNIAAVKEASGNIEQIMDIARFCDKNFVLYSGDDSIALPVLSVGGMGVISVASNIVPEIMNELCSSFFSGNLKKCKEIQFKLAPLIKALFCEINPIPVKTALNMLGSQVGPMRLPLTEMEEANKERLRRELQNLGLI